MSVNHVRKMNHSLPGYLLHSILIQLPRTPIILRLPLLPRRYGHLYLLILGKHGRRRRAVQILQMHRLGTAVGPHLSQPVGRKFYEAGARTRRASPLLHEVDQLPEDGELELKLDGVYHALETLLPDEEALVLDGQ